MAQRKDLQRMSAAMMKIKSPLKNGEGDDKKFQYKYSEENKMKQKFPESHFRYSTSPAGYTVYPKGKWAEGGGDLFLTEKSKIGKTAKRYITPGKFQENPNKYAEQARGENLLKTGKFRNYGK
tara:strand:- start:127 stop:495 length:369 start_codon:yes stop_codon:yes gene_type:complete